MQRIWRKSTEKNHSWYLTCINLHDWFFAIGTAELRLNCKQIGLFCHFCQFSFTLNPKHKKVQNQEQKEDSVNDSMNVLYSFLLLINHEESDWWVHRDHLIDWQSYLLFGWQFLCLDDNSRPLITELFFCRFPIFGKIGKNQAQEIYKRKDWK